MSLDDVFTHEGTSRTVREWAEVLGIHRRAFRGRLLRHLAGKMSLERLLAPGILPARGPRFSAGDIRSALMSSNGDTAVAAAALGCHVNWVRALLVRYGLRKATSRLRSAEKRGPSVYSAPAAREDGAIRLYASAVPAGLVL